MKTEEINGTALVTFKEPDHSKNLLVSERHIAKNHIVPLHWHDYTELEVLCEGRALHIIGNERYMLTPGSAYITTVRDFHSIIPQTDLKILNLSFMAGSLDETIASQFCTGGCKYHCTFDESLFSQIQALFNKAILESKSNAPFSSLMLHHLAEEIVVTMLRVSNPDGCAEIPRLIQQTIAAINLRFRESLTLSAIAAALFVTPNYLGALFKKHIGISFNRYVNLTRLRYACGLLASTDMAVKEIGLVSGFHSVEYFLFIFKKHMETTPTEYRKNRRT